MLYEVITLITLTRGGIVIDVIPVLLKAPCPMYSTVGGKIIDVKVVLLLKQFPAITLVPLWIVKLLGAVPLYSYATLLRYIIPSGLELYHDVPEKTAKPNSLSYNFV